MAKTGLEYLNEAAAIQKEADKIRKRDPINATRLDKAASQKRFQATKKFKTRVRKRGTGLTVRRA